MPFYDAKLLILVGKKYETYFIPLVHELGVSNFWKNTDFLGEDVTFVCRILKEPTSLEPNFLEEDIICTSRACFWRQDGKLPMDEALNFVLKLISSREMLFAYLLQAFMLGIPEYRSEYGMASKSFKSLTNANRSWNQTLKRLTAQNQSQNLF